MTSPIETHAWATVAAQYRWEGSCWSLNNVSNPGPSECQDIGTGESRHGLVEAVQCFNYELVDGAYAFARPFTTALVVRLRGTISD